MKVSKSMKGVPVRSLIAASLLALSLPAFAAEPPPRTVYCRTVAYLSHQGTFVDFVELPAIKTESQRREIIPDLGLEYRVASWFYSRNDQVSATIISESVRSNVIANANDVFILTHEGNNPTLAAPVDLKLGCYDGSLVMYCSFDETKLNKQFENENRTLSTAVPPCPKK